MPRGDVRKNHFTLIERVGEEKLGRTAFIRCLSRLVVAMDHEKITLWIDIGLLDLFLVEDEIASRFDCDATLLVGLEDMLPV